MHASVHHGLQFTVLLWLCCCAAVLSARCSQHQNAWCMACTLVHPSLRLRWRSACTLRQGSNLVGFPRLPGTSRHAEILRFLSADGSLAESTWTSNWAACNWQGFAVTHCPNKMLYGRMIFIGVGFNSSNQVSITLGRVRRRIWVLLDRIKLYLNLKSKGDFAHAKVARNGQIYAKLNLCWKWEAHKENKKEVWMRHDWRTQSLCKPATA